MEKDMATHSRSCLENPIDRGIWWAKVHGLQKLDMTEQLHAQDVKRLLDTTTHLSEWQKSILQGVEHPCLQKNVLYRCL